MVSYLFIPFLMKTIQFEIWDNLHKELIRIFKELIMDTQTGMALLVRQLVENECIRFEVRTPSSMGYSFPEHLCDDSEEIPEDHE